MAIQGISPSVTTAPVAPVPTRVVRASPVVPIDSTVDTEPAVETVPIANPVTAQAAREALDRAIAALDPMARNLQFSIDDATGKTVVKIVDAKTKEVIRQIPSEEILALTSSISKLSGLFIKQKV